MQMIISQISLNSSTSIMTPQQDIFLLQKSQCHHHQQQQPSKQHIYFEQAMYSSLPPLLNISMSPSLAMVIMSSCLQNLYYFHNDNNSNVMLQEPKNDFGADDVIPIAPNGEAIDAFLGGHMRPGPNVERVYHCGICNVEFTNPQDQERTYEFSYKKEE